MRNFTRHTASNVILFSVHDNINDIEQLYHETDGLLVGLLLYVRAKAKAKIFLSLNPSGAKSLSLSLKMNQMLLVKPRLNKARVVTW